MAMAAIGLGSWRIPHLFQKRSHDQLLLRCGRKKSRRYQHHTPLLLRCPLNRHMYTKKKQPEINVLTHHVWVVVTMHTCACRLATNLDVATYFTHAKVLSPLYYQGQHLTWSVYF